MQATSAQAISLSSALASATGSCWDGIAKTKTQVKVRSHFGGLFVNKRGQSRARYGKVWQVMPYFGLKKGGLALLSGVEGALLLAQVIALGEVRLN